VVRVEIIDGIPLAFHLRRHRLTHHDDLWPRRTRVRRRRH
jgi:hypothetical protein